MFRALLHPLPAGIHEIGCPTIIVDGSEDVSVTNGYADELALVLRERR